MAKGDWSAGCFVRPNVFSLLFDENEPPNIISVSTAYNIIQPSGLKPSFARTFTPPAPVPVNQGLTLISQAVTDLVNYEGIPVG